MTTTELEKLRYPIGQFNKPDLITKALLDGYVATIASFPEALRKEVAHLTDTQLDTPYRLGGWTIRQVVHHCADSHMNSQIRLKWALTEDSPVIKAYYEERWAELADSRMMPVESSLKLLEGLHQRWVFLLNSLTTEELERDFIHPEHGRSIKINENTGLYDWHCRHHLAHITELKKRQGWQ
ncbi:YfiT family bacillithiol transferase [Pedobacter foliorum]|uniref:YfiT family bacillithiol transferase n=1 Tax=Pedobacter foliorum TaxID=2739058 RepID=UPI001567610E|nr:putative metal-dependent hydrolase [Pedobacter foliorum]NRF41324.1 putative metal-dependent hydrolase [Pedobacter foliorum]